MKIDVNELIQIQVLLIKRQLKIKHDILFTTNIKVWKQDIEKGDHNPDNVYGQVNMDNYYFFINLKRIKNLRMLYKAIYHELLHLKYPKYPESKIRTLEKRYLN